MTLVGVVVLFLGLLAAGLGAGLALFERIPPRGSLRLMALGVLVGAVGLVVTLLSADDGEPLEAGTFIPLAIVLGVVAYAAWFARRGGTGGPGASGGPGETTSPPPDDA